MAWPFTRNYRNLYELFIESSKVYLSICNNDVLIATRQTLFVFFLNLKIPQNKKNQSCRKQVDFHEEIEFCFIDSLSASNVTVKNYFVSFFVKSYFAIFARVSKMTDFF